MFGRNLPAFLCLKHMWGTESMTQLAKLDCVLNLAAKGFRPFPVTINEKGPPLVAGWQDLATRDPEQLSAIWELEPRLNIGCLMDAGFSIDFDLKNGGLDSRRRMREAGLLRRTYTQRSPSGGYHETYRCSPEVAKVLKNAVGSIPGYPGADIRADRKGYILGAGSTTAAGTYTVEDDAPIAEALPELLAILPKEDLSRAQKFEPPLEGQDSEGEKARAIDYLINQAPEAIEGQGGDNTTIKVINRVRDHNLSEETTLELLDEHWNRTKAIPPWEYGELAKKVQSASKSRQNAIGVKAPEAEFEAVEVAERPLPERPSGTKARRGLVATDWQDDPSLNEQPYLIDGVLGLGTMAVTYGDSNVGKTFVVLDQAVHIAAGREWNGRKVKQGLVVYVAAEGGAGFFKRIAAYKQFYELKHLPFTTVACPIDLQSETADTNALIRLVQEAEQRHSSRCVLIVIDTLARAIAGADENTATDMSKFVSHCDRIRAATGATVDIHPPLWKRQVEGRPGIIRAARRDGY